MGEITKKDILAEHTRLRTALLKEGLRKHEDFEERILIHYPSNGALKYQMEDWNMCLTHMGIKSSLLPIKSSLNAAIKKFKPTMFFTTGAYLKLTKIVVPNDIKLCLINYMPHPSISKPRLDNAFLHMTEFYVSNNPLYERSNYLWVRFEANPITAVMLTDKETRDFVFIGIDSQPKQEQHEHFLFPIVEKYNGILAGSWRKGLMYLSNIHNYDAAYYYSSSRICPNIHQEWHRRPGLVHYTRRGFTIPACGGFQLNENPNSTYALFKRKEMVAIKDDPKVFMKAFEYFINHPEKRHEYTMNGMRRVWREYTLFHTIDKFVEEVNKRD